MRLHHLFLCAAFLISLASCTTIRKTSVSQPVDNQVRSFTIAEASVGQKITASTTWSWNPFKRDRWGLRKGNLVAETLQKEGADVLLEPQFIITKTSYGQRTITVTGFPATYKNFRPATVEDAPLLKTQAKVNEMKHFNGTDFGLISVLLRP